MFSMKNVRVLFTIKGIPISFREVVQVADVNDDREIKKELNKMIQSVGIEGKVRSIVMVEAV